MTETSAKALAYCLECAELRGRSLKDIFTDAERRMLADAILALPSAPADGVREPEVVTNAINALELAHSILLNGDAREQVWLAALKLRGATLSTQDTTSPSRKQVEDHS